MARAAGNIEIGVSTPTVADLKKHLALATDQWQANFCVVPLAHPRYWRDHRRPRAEQFTRSDLVLDSNAWCRLVVGKLSPWIRLDSADEALRKQSEAAFKQEVAWAAHLNVPAVMLPPVGSDAVNYAHCVNQALLSAPHIQFWVRVPITHPPQSTAEAAGGDEDGSSGTGAWASWNRLRCLCEHAPNLGVSLELGADLPDDEAELERWLGEPSTLGLPGSPLGIFREPLRAVVTPAVAYLTNKRGYPTLSRRHQAALARLLQHKPRLLVSGRADAHSEGLGAHVQYLRYLVSQRLAPSQQERPQPRAAAGESLRYEAPYYDFLQAPLQPLQDNLESQTYETFEKAGGGRGRQGALRGGDPVKYERYERAVYLYLCQRHQPGGEPAVVMVVGAGRGPLVAATLRASAASGRRVRAFAVEKNPNAVVTLRGRCATEAGWDAVTVVPGDMREWEAPRAPVLADLLVSELLGSWGDNELSPECLDGAQAPPQAGHEARAQRYLKPGGASIPTDYTSYVAPLSSSRLWNEATPSQGTRDDLAHFETQYVVKVHRMGVAPAPLALAPTHDPRPSGAIDNSRVAQLSFDVPLGGELHGFIGYFHSTLWDDGSEAVHISTEPSTESVGMFSWFPLFIPLRTPVLVPEGGRVEAAFWRNASRHRVWYEWALTEPQPSPIHNPNGRSYHIGL
ncbi:hypothetical protein EMIHUDRAFT_67341 [Emiliania huxleyi CCMP1516]|uniref:Protein arginine N-methyltransferase n=2 Tax=Emiliania huxleyi TaxID=2903 RepID=A0A0D3IK72_EMIH1|nr:hypothetical protein EMIHUDRAFT_67341 [Emiliania huxleyi CCMP1516]EOD11657.1 hypothetical protein EMIHUDRAFT_67341 [Emiliania huxleyi CCMP1516]|eukprot:XP_005764086.1 hypothetical protein EMIHUDRAFT_67341 [Emiliania huxleyi CCMP1516]